MSAKVNVGIVSTSWFADWFHLPNLEDHPGAEVRAICGQNPERAEQMAQKHRIPRWYTDYREMIEKGGLDAVIVATPEESHYEITMAAVEARLHVLCEKALAMTGEHAREMYRAAEKAGVKHMTCFTYRWFPCYRYLRQLVSEGYIGALREISIQYWFSHGRWTVAPWRFDGARSHGVLSDLGSQLIDLVHWLGGDIVEVGAVLGRFVTRQRTDGQPAEPAIDAAVLSLSLDCGAIGTVAMSGVACTAERGQEQTIMLHGSDGTLECRYSQKGSDPDAGILRTPFEITGSRVGMGAFEELTVPGSIWGTTDRSNLIEGFRTESIGTRAFIDAILEDRLAVPGFRDGLKAQLVIDAALEADRTARRVRVEPV